MHRQVDPIFRQHEEWLDAGGAGALQVVQTSNLMQLVSQGLEAVESEGEAAGYERGWEAGLARGRVLERQAHEKRAEEGR